MWTALSDSYPGEPVMSSLCDLCKQRWGREGCTGPACLAWGRAAASVSAVISSLSSAWGTCAGPSGCFQQTLFLSGKMALVAEQLKCACAWGMAESQRNIEF